MNVKPCFKCGIFGHVAAKCHNDIVCTECASKKDTNLCNKETLRFINCLYWNNKYQSVILHIIVTLVKFLGRI